MSANPAFDTNIFYHYANANSTQHSSCQRLIESNLKSGISGDPIFSRAKSVPNKVVDEINRGIEYHTQLNAEFRLFLKERGFGFDEKVPNHRVKTTIKDFISQQKIEEKNTVGYLEDFFSADETWAGIMRQWSRMFRKLKTAHNAIQRNQPCIIPKSDAALLKKGSHKLRLLKHGDCQIVCELISYMNRQAEITLKFFTTDDDFINARDEIMASNLLQNTMFRKLEIVQPTPEEIRQVIAG